MLLTILIAAIQLSQAAAAQAPSAHGTPGPLVSAAAKDCQRPTLRMAKDSLRPRRFTELPSARLELAVIRQVDGCPIPAVLREGIGAAPLPGD